MNRKSVFQISLVVVLAAGLVYYNFGNWFAPAMIEIAHDIRPDQPRGGRRASSDQPNANTVAFFFTTKYRLTTVKVVPVEVLKTNKYARPLWHLVSDSGSVPVKSLIYGVPIEGMKPAVKEALPAPLQPYVKYRLLLEAGSIKGEHDFQTTERASPVQ